MSRTKKDIMQGIHNVDKSKFVDNNTVEYHVGKCRYIRLHDTDILTFVNGDSKIILNTGGWRTVTTKDRINKFLPEGFYLYQEKSKWYLSQPDGETSLYYDGIEISDNKIIKVVLQDKKTDKLLKLISEYCKALNKLDKFPVPSSGDCFYCQMHTVDEGKPLGEVTDNKDHLISHLKEKYIHGSLILNALKWKGYRDEQLSFIWNMKNITVRAVRGYFKRQLQIA
jgi:hypothetical protein